MVLEFARRFNILIFFPMVGTFAIMAGAILDDVAITYEWSNGFGQPSLIGVVLLFSLNALAAAPPALSRWNRKGQGFNLIRSLMTLQIPFLPSKQAQLVPTPLLDRLTYLAELPPNWDGEGGLPVSQVTVDKIRDLLQRAYSVGGSKLSEPFISPAYDGTLVAEWKTRSGKELILDVPAGDTTPGFLLVEPIGSGEEFETDAKIGDEWPIETVIQRLLAN